MKKNNKKLKIGVDIHGTLDANIEYFRSLTNSMKDKSCCEIHIITGSTLKEVSRLLEKNNIYFTHFYSIEKDLLKRGIQHWFKTDWVTGKRCGPFFEDKLWNKAKSIYCLENKIDLMFDDNEEYLKYFKTPYIKVKGEVINGSS